LIVIAVCENPSEFRRFTVAELPNGSLIEQVGRRADTLLRRRNASSGRNLDAQFEPISWR
jgi:hypothetical protein